MNTKLSYIYTAGRKTFKAASIDGIWSQYNRYAKSKGYTECLQGTRYVGFMAWKNPENGAVLELTRVSPIIE